MKKGKIKMKKFMILAAVAAMVTGAWAATGDSYTFNLGVLNLPTSFDHMSGDSAVYLIDKANGNVLAYATMDKFDENAPGGDGKLQTSVPVTHEGFDPDYTKPDGLKSCDAHTISKGSSVQVTTSTDGETKNVQFTILFTSDALVKDSWKQTFDGGSGLELALIGTVVDKDGEAISDYYQTFDVMAYTYQSTSANFQTEGTYSPSAVPEPTSAMLLLLGVAGLCLKRKVA